MSNMNRVATLSHNTPFKTVDSAQKLSIMSWNVLHKDFALCEIDTTFSHATEDMLLYSKRLPNLRSKIAHSNADIVCLQEVSQSSFDDDFGTYFQQKHGYDYRCNPNSGAPERSKGKDKTTNEGDFTTAIMYKSRKFECVYEDYRTRATILLLTNKLEQSQCRHCTKSQRICLLHSIFVVTVHLESPSNGKKNDSARVNALKKVLKRIRFCISDKLKWTNSIVSETANIRILIMGDFNSGVEDPPSMMLLNRNPDSKEHPFRFDEAYHQKMSSGEVGMEQEFDPNSRIKQYPSIITNNFVYSIDLLFYTTNNMTLHGVRNTIPEDIESDIKWKEKCTQRIEQWMESGKQTNKNGQMQLADFSNLWALPNDQVPSDHLPIFGVFEMKNLCRANNGSGNSEDGVCRCCVEVVKKKKLSKKERKEMKRKKKMKNQNADMADSGWKFHEMTSF